MNKPSKYYVKVLSLFKDVKGNPFQMSLGQEEIFKAIYKPEIERVAVKAITQYGKSEIASMAIVAVAIERQEKILIIAPSIKQASIIMNKVINHLFDHSVVTGMVKYSKHTIERLKEEKSKTRITFRNGSEIMILTAEASTSVKEAKGLMGFGASIVLLDESALINDTMFSKILRMVGGIEHGKLIQLGNPFESNHFGRAFKSKRYHKISIDYHQALKEGRVRQAFLDEAREEMGALEWLIFYECEFPSTGADNAVIPLGWIENAVNQDGCEGGHKQSGLDVARFGRDSTVYIFRKGGKVERLEKTEQMDTMEVTGWTRGFLDKDTPDVHCTDIVGIGSGVHDRLEEVQDEDDITWGDTDLVPINVGAGPTDDEAKEKFYNLRAQIFWYLRDRFKPNKNGKSDASIPDDPQLKKELSEIRYKFSSERKIKLEAKDEMKKRLGSSPDKADALALAFFDTTESEPDIMIADA